VSDHGEHLLAGVSQLLGGLPHLVLVVGTLAHSVLRGAQSGRHRANEQSDQPEHQCVDALLRLQKSNS
jgi:hypothetical protein